MYFSTLVFVLASVCTVIFAQNGISEENMQVILGYHKECKAETNIDDTLASGVMSGNFPDDPVLRRHVLCMSKKLGVLNDAGEIQADVVKTMISKIVADDGKVTELMETCAVAKDSPEDTAFALSKCIFQGTH